jgi:N-acetylglucosamine-6-sulfatase
MTPASPARPARRAVLAIAVLALSLIVPLLGSTSPAAAATVPPNVVIFLSDDQSMGTLRATPNVRNEIATPGVSFSRAYISDPLCCPSRSSILTGLYATHTGVFTNGEGTLNRDHGGTAAFEGNGNDDRTIAKALDDAGYQTALFGKYLNGYRSYSEANPGPTGYFRPDGWDVWRAFYQNNGKYFDYDLLRDDVGTRPRVVHYGSANGPKANDYSTTVLGNMLRFWLHHRDPSAPFFAYVAPYGPHGPSNFDHRDAGKFPKLPPFTSPAIDETHDEKADMPTYVRNRNLTQAQLTNMQRKRRRQFLALSSFDRQVGLVMTYLQDTIDPRTGRPYIENTIVIYLSDNGVMWGEHDLIGKSVPYERATHVPMYLRYDGAPAGSGYIPGSTNRRLVANIDVAPTIYDLTGVAPPVPVDGVDLLRGHDDGVMLASLTQAPNGVPSFCGLITPDGWKYVVYVPQEGVIDEPYEEELYRVRDDPAELDNRAEDPSDAAAMAAEARAKAMLYATSGGRHWCALPGVPQSWYNAWS